MDRHYPLFGGLPVNLNESEENLSDADSARRTLRSTVRTTTARAVATIVARPLAGVQFLLLANL